MTQDALFLAGCALVVFVKLAHEAWKRRRLQRALDELAEAVETWNKETGYPKECVAEGLGPRIERRKPSPVVWLGRLDRSAIQALRDIRRQRA